MRFSVIVPVYNRPAEVEELLESLAAQAARNFEVVVVDDGSDERCKHITDSFDEVLDIRYHWKENSGPGPTRNFGARHARGSYLIFFDSDCIVPPHYFDTVETTLAKRHVDYFGGPDRAARSFRPIQRAINYSMTSFLTTGGIRGGKRSVDTFYPRSYNMGISREAFRAVDGFSNMRFGEDVDLSLRLEAAGYESRLIERAFVYHKRRTSFRAFFKQVFNSGLARIHLQIRHPGSLKIVHSLPGFFVGYLAAAAALSPLTLLPLLPAAVLALLFFADAGMRTRSPVVAALAVVASFIQITAYGSGFLVGLLRKWFSPNDGFAAFEETLYD